MLQATTKTRHYETPERRAGVVEYTAGEVDVFLERTLIDPRSYPIPYAHLRTCYMNEKLEVLGRLPEDFREKMTTAATNKLEWRKKDRDYFFNWVS